MKRLRRHPVVASILVVALIAILVVGGYGYYLAEDANLLPWQPEPTRISSSLTPFADIPGFDSGVTTDSTPTSSPAP